MHNRIRLIALLSMLLAPLFVFAQGSGAADGSATDVAADPAKPADSTAQQPAAATPPDSGGAQEPAPPTPPVQPSSGGAPGQDSATSTPVPVGTGTVQPTTPTTNTGPQPPNALQPTSALIVPGSFPNLPTATPTPVNSGNPWLWPLIAVAVVVLAVIPFGFLLAGWMKKKPSQSNDSDNRCFDIKKIMEEKLKELTDVKAMIREKAIEKGKEALRDSVSGTTAGDLLVRAEKLQEQYNKLKKLYEECQIDIDRYKLKGVLVENSLLDKTILEHLRVIRTRTENDRVLHDIRLSSSQIDDIQKNMIDTTWFFHLWEPGKDSVTVVFKDALFTIKHSDKSTWTDAIAHGLAHGIPREQLDFRIE